MVGVYGLVMTEAGLAAGNVSRPIAPMQRNRIMIDVVPINGPVLLLRARGRINILSADAFEAAVRNAVRGESRAVIIECSDVTYLSSAGLRAFLRLWQDLNQKNQNLHICALKPYIREVFRIIGFDRLIPIHADIPATLTAVEGEKG